MAAYTIILDSGEVACFMNAISSAIGRFVATDDNAETLLRLQTKLANCTKTEESFIAIDPTKATPTS